MLAVTLNHRFALSFNGIKSFHAHINGMPTSTNYSLARSNSKQIRAMDQSNSYLKPPFPELLDNTYLNHSKDTKQPLLDLTREVIHRLNYGTLQNWRQHPHIYSPLSTIIASIPTPGYANNVVSNSSRPKSNTCLTQSVCSRCIARVLVLRASVLRAYMTPAQV